MIPDPLACWSKTGRSRGRFNDMCVQARDFPLMTSNWSSPTDPQQSILFAAVWTLAKHTSQTESRLPSPNDRVNLARPSKEGPSLSLFFVDVHSTERSFDFVCQIKQSSRSACYPKPTELGGSAVVEGAAAVVVPRRAALSVHASSSSYLITAKGWAGLTDAWWAYRESACSPYSAPWLRYPDRVSHFRDAPQYQYPHQSNSIILDRFGRPRGLGAFDSSPFSLLRQYSQDKLLVLKETSSNAPRKWPTATNPFFCL